MDSKNHQSEDEFGWLAGKLLKHLAEPRLLIGGLGFGFTLRAALDALPADRAGRRRRARPRGGPLEPHDPRRTSRATRSTIRASP